MKNFIIVFAAGFLSLNSLAEIINPFPRQIIKKSLVKKFDFDKLYDSWDDDINCSSKINNGNLIIISTQNDPQVFLRNISYQAPLKITLRAKSKAKGDLQFFWTTASSPALSQSKMVTVTTIPDGKWHTYSIIIPENEKINMLRLDPFGAEGEMEIDFIKIFEIEYQPLEIISVSKKSNIVEAIVTNHTNKKITFSYKKKIFTLQPAAKIKITNIVNTNLPFSQMNFFIKITSMKNIPPLVRPVNIVNLNAETEWINLNNGDLKLKVTPNGTGAKVYYKNKFRAVIFPLAELKYNILKFNVNVLASNKIELISKNVDNFSIEINGNCVDYKLKAKNKIKAPVIKIFDSIEQALLPGVEYLGKNEKSSSDLDLKIPQHIRFKPNKMWVTMPLIAFVTSDFSLALRWANMNLQPYFAAPDFFNGQASALAALEGKNIKLKIKFDSGWNSGSSLEKLVEWSVKLSGLPSLPKPPRSAKAELKLCLKGIESVRGSNGWGHCVEFQKLPYADYVSLIWRATGKIVKTKNLIPGGSHLPAPESFFITGRADKWLQSQKNCVKNFIKSQNPDGSFTCNNKFREGHFDNTASGFCAIPAETLLRVAFHTGNSNALTAGLKTLDYLSRFRTPRGSQTWEIPLHTPDILASARITKSYIFAYKLTGEKKYLDAARKWAMTGVPFVYLWGNQPIMKYATIAVLGATGWVAPNWMGLPVQWCGLVYADAILDLAEYDKTFPWKKLAKGIFICAEQMQYTEGKSIGTLPDSFTLKTQTRNIYDIGPLMLIQFQRRFAGKPVGIYTARDEKNIITAPFPVKIKDGKAMINARPGLKYQIILNGRIKNILSKGKDVIVF